MKQFKEYLLLSIWIFLTIVTCATVWNFVTDVTLVVASILLFGLTIFKAVKGLKKINKIDY
jgi:small basic protein